MAIGWLIILLFGLLPLVFIIARVRGVQGKPQLSEPYCAKCGYDLRVNWDSSMSCPECGADLKARDAVNFGKPSKSAPPWMILIAIVMALFFMFLIFTRVTTTRGRVAKPVAAPAPVIQQVTPYPADNNSSSEPADAN